MATVPIHPAAGCGEARPENLTRVDLGSPYHRPVPESHSVAMLAVALSSAATAFYLGGAAKPLPFAVAPAASSLKHAAFMMAEYTSKDELLLEEEIERSGVEADIEEVDKKAVASDLAAKVDWSPSARGEPGKTPRDLKYGPLNM